MKTNKELIEAEANKHDLTIGCYHEQLEKLSQDELKKVLDSLQFEEDTDVCIDIKPYVVEIDIVDNEVDLRVLSKAEYIDRYGDERYQD